MSSRASLDETRKRYDPEENALQQALAASMTETEGQFVSIFKALPRTSLLLFKDKKKAILE